MLNAILWLSRTGAPWRDLPERYGPWKSVYTKITRWAHDSVLKCVFRLLTSDTDMEYLLIDSTVVSAHQHSAGAKNSNPDAEENHFGRSYSGTYTIPPRKSTLKLWTVD